MNQIISFLFGTLIQTVITFIILSSIINYFILQKIKEFTGLKSIIFGIEITLIGMLVFYLTYTYTFTSIFWSIAMYFVPVYIITTGFTVSLIGYISKAKDEHS